MRDAGSAGTLATTVVPAVPDIASAPITDIVGAVREAAEQLRRSETGVARATATREFWRFARMLRASQPPLRLVQLPQGCEGLVVAKAAEDGRVPEVLVGAVQIALCGQGPGQIQASVAVSAAA